MLLDEKIVYFLLGDEGCSRVIVGVIGRRSKCGVWYRVGRGDDCGVGDIGSQA